MKKTLIALAAVAVSSAAFAQSTVTLSGKLRFAYESTKSAANVKTNGLRVTDGDFALTAVEDLGGGLKATAFMNVQSRGRTTAISGRDAYLSLAGGFGTVMIGAVESGNGLLGLGGAGATVYGLDDNVVLQGATNVDMLRYTSPSMSGFTAYVSLMDQNNDATAGAGTGGMQTASVTQDAGQIGVNYSAGALALAADYTSYGQNAAALPAADDRFRISGSYDLGVVKLGAGYQKAENTAGIAKTEYLLGLSAPLGAGFTAGLNYGSSKTDGVAGRNKGTDLGVKYDLSKRTYLAVAYQTVKAAGATASSNKYRIQLAHSF